MIKVIRQGAYYMEGRLVKESQAFMTSDKKAVAVKNTLVYKILKAHGGEKGELRPKFDCLVSDGHTYADIVRMAKAIGLSEFSFPYIVGNGGTPFSAEDDASADERAFGRSAAKKYGGDSVPKELSSLHRYVSECAAKCGGMLLCSDGAARYGALGAMAVRGSEWELLKYLSKTPDPIPRPETAAVWLRGKLRRGVGPLDVALSLIKAVSKGNAVQHKVLEFIGPGIANLPMDYRIGIDAMTAATGCLSTVWETDERTREFYIEHGREGDFAEMRPVLPAYYDGAVVVDLAHIEPMLSLPLQDGILSVREWKESAPELLSRLEEEGRKLDPAFSLQGNFRGGKVYASQGVIAGNTGLYETVAEAAEIVRGGNACADGFEFAVCPASLPVYKGLSENGVLSVLAGAGASVSSASGCVPVSGALSVRCVAGEEGRGGFVLSDGRAAAVVLMDARSVAATAKCGGEITSALDAEYSKRFRKYRFDGEIYSRVYRGAGRPLPETELCYGRGISDWREQSRLPDELLIKAVSRLTDPVTTADDLLPLDGTSSFRSDPERLASFALSRKDAGYAARAREVRAWEEERKEKGNLPEEVLKELNGFLPAESAVLGSAVVLMKVGGAREQAAFCQRELGGIANICKEYAAQYRTDLINRGILPFTCEKPDFRTGDYLYIEGIADAVSRGDERILARHISKGKVRDVVLTLGSLSAEERAVLLAGSLINRIKGGN